ncbi:hypothetical protein BCR44DRAFT_347146 [Catenaria anguillulae PL171]|uniref:Uncharacterized protein n=1 Tax=Catenaria anguillulae PL171 TaxID=765915 RepID=A0A1Y2H7I1_9FUNG|nr:hypothetical protein BCR44DRAFT_347146 [Catenaria anguillulae PL171]
MQPDRHNLSFNGLGGLTQCMGYVDLLVRFNKRRVLKRETAKVDRNEYTLAEEQNPGVGPAPLIYNSTQNLNLPI